MNTRANDGPGMLAVEKLMLWNGRPSCDEVDALEEYGLVEWTGDTFRLTEAAASIKAALHKAQGDERWELCQAYARRFAEDRGQGELF